MKRLFLVLTLLCSASACAAGDPGLVDDDEPALTAEGLGVTGGNSVPASPEWTARGCATRTGAALTSLTIPNVTVATGEVLVVYYGCRNAAGGGTGSVLSTWGATAMNVPDNPGGTFAGASISGGQWYLRPGTAGATSDVVVTFEVLDAYTDLVGCAETISVDTSYVGEFVGTGAGGTPDVEFGKARDPCGGISIGGCISQEAPSASAGIWIGPNGCSADFDGIFTGQRSGTATATPVTLATFHGIHCTNCEMGISNGDISPSFWVMPVGTAYGP